MATLHPVPINRKQIKSDLNDFRALLNDPSRPELSESTDILPFFKAHPQLCAFMGTYDSYIVDFKMLLVIGRDKYLTDQGLKDRFGWRNESVFVAGKQVHCLTFDKLYEDLRLRLETRF